MEAFDAVVVGNAGVDTNVYLGHPDLDLTVEGHFTENLDCVGQAGAYAARGFARLGKRTAFIGYVGEDAAGHLVREAFEADGIDTEALFVDPAGTARSVNLMFPDGRRRNFYDGKGHAALSPDPATCRAVLGHARLAHFNIPNWARKLLPDAREAGVRIACDLQDMPELDDPYRRDFIEAADILFFSSANHPDPRPVARTLLKDHPDRIVVCGMGARGCLLGSSQGLRHFPPVELRKPIIDTNGAGDSLAVGFLASHVLEGASLEDAILKGQIAARHACTLKADSAKLIRKAELERYFRRLR